MGSVGELTVPLRLHTVMVMKNRRVWEGHSRGQGCHSTWHIPQPCWRNSVVQIVLDVFLELHEECWKSTYAWKDVKSHSASLGS